MKHLAFKGYTILSVPLKSPFINSEKMSTQKSIEGGIYLLSLIFQQGLGMIIDDTGCLKQIQPI